MSNNRYRIKSGPSKELLTAFTPRAKLESSHSMIHNHMKAHYKRIASVQAKIDSSPPTAMQRLTKANEHQASSSIKTSQMCDQHLHTDNSGLNSSEEDRWRHYVTKTGRLTGYLTKTRNHVSPSKSERKEIWKPAFSMNTTTSIYANYPSLNESAICEISNLGLHEKTMAGIMESSGSDVETFKSVKDEYSDNHDSSAASPASIHLPAKHSVTSTEVEEDKRKQFHRQEELEYLGFISGITQDILSRRFLSDAALELLIGGHIERNLHRLDKDKMIERVTELKEQLGFPT